MAAENFHIMIRTWVRGAHPPSQPIWSHRYLQFKTIGTVFPTPLYTAIGKRGPAIKARLQGAVDSLNCGGETTKLLLMLAVPKHRTRDDEVIVN